ncbi:MAG: response regulator [Planctomycetaceae bacterium]|nr:response regulator [Planctomycetaceae bacterium]
MPETLPPRIFAIDDDPAILRFIQAVIENNGLAIDCFPSGEEFFQHSSDARVGCVIIDLNLPGISGAEIQSRLLQLGSDLSVIIASGGANIATAVQIMQNGAVTLLEKPYSSAALMAAVREGLDRSQEAFARRLQTNSVQERLATLTSDERAVLDGLMAGFANKLIAQNLVFSSRTVERHRSSVLRKMQVNSLAELAAVLSTLTVAGNPPGV